jgi:hypothetical protein
VALQGDAIMGGGIQLCLEVSRCGSAVPIQGVAAAATDKQVVEPNTPFIHMSPPDPPSTSCQPGCVDAERLADGSSQLECRGNGRVEAEPEPPSREDREVGPAIGTTQAGPARGPAVGSVAEQAQGPAGAGGEAVDPIMQILGGREVSFIRLIWNLPWEVRHWAGYPAATMTMWTLMAPVAMDSSSRRGWKWGGRPWAGSGVQADLSLFGVVGKKMLYSFRALSDLGPCDTPVHDYLYRLPVCPQPTQVVPFALGMFVLVEGLSVQGW